MVVSARVRAHRHLEYMELSLGLSVLIFMGNAMTALTSSENSQFYRTNRSFTAKPHFY